MKEGEDALVANNCDFSGKTAKSREGFGHIDLPLNREKMFSKYEQRKEIYKKIADDLVAAVEGLFVNFSFSPVVNGRVKDFQSYYNKCKKYLTMSKDEESVPPINDLIGIRVVCPFKEDTIQAKKIIEKNFSVEEIRLKGHAAYLESHDNFKEFGYESMHLLVRLPKDILEARRDGAIEIAEIQIRTTMQDAWAEIEHKLFYKKGATPLFDKMQRKLAAVNASFFLADAIFDEVRKHQRKLVKQFAARRKTFFKKIEESTDGLLFENENEDYPQPLVSQEHGDSFFMDDSSIDTLLLSALTLHNRGKYKEAVAAYTKILDFHPNDTICTLIYKHRGMAHFACSQYEEAIEDFTNALKKDGKSYQAAYYRGVVNSVLKNYSGAIDDYTLSLSIYPYQAFCILRRGQAYYHTGDYPQALSDCEASLAMEPQNEVAQKFKSLLQDKIKL